MVLKHYKLFVSFFKVGILGYGGGPASIPLIQKEVVEKYHWIDNKEFGDLLALANTLPGPIATKLAGYLGYRILGVTGLLNALLASILPTIILMIIFLKSLSSFKELDWVKGMTAAIIPVVGMMLLVLTYQFFNQTAKGMGIIQTIVMSSILFVLLHFLQIHPGIIIGILLLIALTASEKSKKITRKKEDSRP